MANKPTSSTAATTVVVSTKSVELDADQAKALEAYITAKKAMKALEDQKAEAERILREALGSADSATVGGVTVIKVSHRKRNNFDAKKFAEAYPELHAEFASVKDFTALLTL